jgi:hypothetical protein
MAVPMTVKMPEPITAPMPSAVSDHGPSDFFNANSGSIESASSLSMDLRATSWLSRSVLLIPPVGGEDRTGLRTERVHADRPGTLTFVRILFYASRDWVPQVRIFGPGKPRTPFGLVLVKKKAGCPILAAFLFLRQGWETTNPIGHVPAQ